MNVCQATQSIESCAGAYNMVMCFVQTALLQVDSIKILVSCSRHIKLPHQEEYECHGGSNE